MLSFGLQVTLRGPFTLFWPVQPAYTLTMSELYDIYYAGGLIEGYDESTVRANLGKLFKANDATLEKLFSGKPQAVKRGVDKEGAVKYRNAMTKAGAVAVIRAQPQADTAIHTAVSPEPSDQPKQSMAERLSALTGEADPAANMTLAPAGSEVLNPDERPVVTAPDIDLSGLSLSDLDEQALEESSAAAPSAPDTSHITLAAAGTEILPEQVSAAVAEPDVSHLTLAEAGADIPNLPNEKSELDPDTSSISLAPEGSDVLEEEFKAKDSAVAPDTSHLTLAEAASKLS